MKGSEGFAQQIKEFLDTTASTDEEFAKKYKNEKKSLDECIQYIFGEVQNSGNNGFEDSIIYGWALHYYEEDDVKIKNNSVSRVVSNTNIELSESEIEEAKERALREVINEQKKSLKSSKKASNVSDDNGPVQGSLF